MVREEKKEREEKTRRRGTVFTWGEEEEEEEEEEVIQMIEHVDTSERPPRLAEVSKRTELGPHCCIVWNDVFTSKLQYNTNIRMKILYWCEDGVDIQEKRPMQEHRLMSMLWRMSTWPM